ncbi:MAG: response regulator [Planctomycetes bacterium]|nr:response regulator [Planctomycetota bacterium]
MRLDALTPAHVRSAIDLYLRHAYPPGTGGRPRITSADFAGHETISSALEAMDRLRATDVEGCRRYSLQVGNHRYPFMKLVVQEYLVNGEYFFAVDTHDELDVRPNHPDYDAFQELKTHNRRLKLEVESAWRSAGLPTLDDLRSLCEELVGSESEDRNGLSILLVEDDVAVAFALRTWLRAKGYAVELAHTGERTLERLREGPLPDLVILDFELPGLDGESVLGALRGDPRTAAVCVLMATASKIDLARLAQVNGVLHKPYPRELLFATLRQMLSGREPALSGSGR